MRRLVVPTLFLVLTLLGLAAPTAAEEPTPVVNLTAPAVSGTAVYRGTLAASTGAWDPAEATYTFQWLRDGTPIAGATAPHYRPALADIGHRLAARVTATAPDHAPGVATSAPTTAVRRAGLVLLERPGVTGVPRYLRTLSASAGEWAQRIDSFHFRWLRDGEPIRRATHDRYRLTHRDVGHRIAVQVRARKEGFTTRLVNSYAVRVGHRVPLRRTVHYTVETRGTISTSLAEFRRQAHATLNDPRGWRTTGTAFQEVASGGSMTLVLAQANRVPEFSPVCSARWSCRVGRYVVINQDRWRYASTAWRSRGGSLRDYRHMVVNHETGHWLGHGHRSCPGAGAPAFVMQQQSISLGACRINPWPRPAEWSTPRF